MVSLTQTKVEHLPRNKVLREPVEISDWQETLQAIDKDNLTSLEEVEVRRILRLARKYQQRDLNNKLLVPSTEQRRALRSLEIQAENILGVQRR